MKHKMTVRILLMTIAISTMAIAANAQERSKPLANGNLFPEKGLTDPHCIIENGRLYLFMGHDQSWRTEDTWKMDRWEIWSTDNLVDWKYESKILPTDTYIGDRPTCWAGDIMKHKGKYYWYFSNRSLNTGVMVADSPTGPFKDALGKPLIPEGLTKTKSYDPEIFQEDGKNYIIFGAGLYHIAQLNDDCISLAEEPKPILVQDTAGNTVGTDDKNAMFKKDGWYYLVWGPHYAMSKNLYGPYLYKGDFVFGGHSCIFEWKDGYWYTIQERGDVYRFYRTVKLNPVMFNDDGTVIPENMAKEVYKSNTWDFDISAQGWQDIRGTYFVWEDGKIKGEIYGRASIQNAIWSGNVNLKDRKNTLVIKLKNMTEATQAKLYVASYTPSNKYWYQIDSEIFWNETPTFVFDIKPNDTEFTEYRVDFSDYDNYEEKVKQFRIDLALGVTTGSWEIESIAVE